MKRHATTDTLPDWNPGPNRPITTPKARWYGYRTRKQREMFDKRTEKWQEKSMPNDDDAGEPRECRLCGRPLWHEDGPTHRECVEIERADRARDEAKDRGEDE